MTPAARDERPGRPPADAPTDAPAPERGGRAWGPSVTFVDARYVRRTVTLRSAEGTPGARGASCLVFESAGAIRRVYDVPAGWRDLAPAALEALSWRR